MYQVTSKIEQLKTAEAAVFQPKLVMNLEQGRQEDTLLPSHVDLGAVQSDAEEDEDDDEEDDGGSGANPEGPPPSLAG